MSGVVLVLLLIGCVMLGMLGKSLTLGLPLLSCETEELDDL